MKEIKQEQKEYPNQLIEIQNRPKRLFIEGNSDLLNSKCIAVVGSRICTEYGEKWCRFFVKEFVRYGLTIISGMAVGIDSIAHNTAINYSGNTIAVLPSGLKRIYPPQNEDLYNKILRRGGCIISEYSPKSKADSRKFLERNRIVSGLSVAVLVVEAAYRSGTSVTARIAKNQGREVYCIPGSLDNIKSVGTNNLIREFAKIAVSPIDVLNQLGIIDGQIYEPLKSYKKDISNISEEYRDIYKVISDKPMDINAISKKCNKSAKETMSKLTFLELEGKIKRIPGNRYILENT